MLIHPRRGARPGWLLTAAASGLALLASACGSGAAGAGGGAVTLRLGYFPNLTHAPALIALQKGFLARELGSAVTLETQSFNAGPAAIQALVGGAIDATFVGPSPAVNAYVKSQGDALRIVAGAASGGASLVVRGDESIISAADLRGRTVATPQLGNTQDVALRTWLAKAGLHTDLAGGGDVHISPTDNSRTMQLFVQKQIDAAWVPEPYATRLVQEDGGRVLVDEASLWPGGRFATTVLVVTRTFLADHEDAVERLIRGEVDAIDLATSDPAAARAAVNAHLVSLQSKSLATKVLDAAWQHVTFTVDPLAASLQTEVDHARSVGLVTGSADIHGILDLRALNAVLRSLGRTPVDAAGLGSA